MGCGKTNNIGICGKTNGRGQIFWCDKCSIKIFKGKVESLYITTGVNKITENITEALGLIPQLMDLQETIDTLKAESKTLLETGAALSANQCIFTDDDGLVGDEYGHSICLKSQELEIYRRKYIELTELLTEFNRGDG